MARFYERGNADEARGGHRIVVRTPDGKRVEIDLPRRVFANLGISTPARPGKGKSAPRDEGPRGRAGAAKAAFRGCGSDEPGPQPLA